MPPTCRRRPSRSLLYTSPCTPMSVFYAVLSGGNTQHHPLSVANAKNRVVNAAHGGTGRHPQHAHIVIEPFVIVGKFLNVRMTHKTSRLLRYSLVRANASTRAAPARPREQGTGICFFCLLKLIPASRMQEQDGSRDQVGGRPPPPGPPPRAAPRATATLAPMTKIPVTPLLLANYYDVLLHDTCQ